MPLHPELESLLVCPQCRLGLDAVAEGRLCRNCGAQYPELSGVPLLRTGATKESVVPTGGNGYTEVHEILNDRGLQRFLRDLFGTNYVPHPFPIEDHIKPGDKVLNLGAGMTGKKSDRSVNLDYFLFPTVDVVADAAAIPFADDTFDFVSSEFMLEHVSSPFTVCKEVIRVLKPGGHLYISYPFIHPYHSFPGDYFRYTPTGLERMLPGMRVISKGPLSGPASRWIGTTADLSCFLMPGPKSRLMLRGAILALLFPLKYLDIILNKHPMAMDHSVTLYGFFQKT